MSALHARLSLFHPAYHGVPSIFKTTESIDDLFARYGQSYRVLVMIAGMAASFTMVVSGSIVNVAVPAVMGAFGVGLDQAQLMTSAFNGSGGCAPAPRGTC